MKAKKNQKQKGNENDCDTGRRSFITKLGKSILVASAFSVISLTPFACKKSDDGPNNGGGY